LFLNEGKHNSKNNILWVPYLCLFLSSFSGAVEALVIFLFFTSKHMRDPSYHLAAETGSRLILIESDFFKSEYFPD
jgi:hypothetical protein